MWCSEAKRQTKAIRVLRKEVSSSPPRTLFDTPNQPLPLQIARTTRYYANLNDFLYLFSSSSFWPNTRSAFHSFFASFLIFGILSGIQCERVRICMQGTGRKFSAEYKFSAAVYRLWPHSARNISHRTSSSSSPPSPSSTCINWWWLLVKLCDDILSRPLRSCYRINSDTKMDFFFFSPSALLMLYSMSSLSSFAFATLLWTRLYDYILFSRYSRLFWHRDGRIPASPWCDTHNDAARKVGTRAPKWNLFSGQYFVIHSRNDGW